MRGSDRQSGSLFSYVDLEALEAWASMKSFRPKDGCGEPQAPGRNGGHDFHGEVRSNDTHASTTDPDARLLRKSAGQEAKLCFMGHALMENRSGLVVDACLTRADGHAERIAALAMIEPTPIDQAASRWAPMKATTPRTSSTNSDRCTSRRMSRPSYAARLSTHARRATPATERARSCASA
jgi:hypothetical protein